MKSVLFTDEAGFTRNVVVNSHNLHLWADENPHGIIQTWHQQRFVVNVWSGIIGNHLVGPFINDGRLDSQLYLVFLENHLNYLLEDCGGY